MTRRIRTNRSRRVSGSLGLFIAVGLGVLSITCKRNTDDVSAAPEASSRMAIERIPSRVNDKPGMVWIPAGTLVAGTDPRNTPRIAEEEMPGVAIPMNGFFIDVYPYPNEPGAIPTTNVTRDEAARLCNVGGKRLCSELEWEHACKGPDNSTYEYGANYREQTCGTGQTAEKSAKKPNGEHGSCRSAFGVLDMHGGVWEWTDSSWGRGSPMASFGVLRGGNAKAGELVGRCANALGRTPQQRQASIGFRCCAGARNEAQVTLSRHELPFFEAIREPGHLARSTFSHLTKNLWGSKETDVSAYDFSRAWYWRPAINEELIVALGCEKKGGPWGHCGGIVARELNGQAMLLAQFSTGPRIADILRQEGTPALLRARGVDVRGTFARDFTYSYGRILVSDESRP